MVHTVLFLLRLTLILYTEIKILGILSAQGVRRWMLSRNKRQQLLMGCFILSFGHKAIGCNELLIAPASPYGSHRAITFEFNSLIACKIPEFGYPLFMVRNQILLFRGIYIAAGVVQYLPYIYKQVGGSNGIAYTRPNVVHTMLFLPNFTLKLYTK